MIKVGDVLVSDEIKEVEFVCNLEKCKGACCVEGELGAPLDDDELPILEAIQDEIRPYLTKQGLKSIKRHGAWVLDEDGDFSTPTIGGKECAYANFDEQGVIKCGIEQAYLDGKTKFRKPISCHLYPIRVTKKKNFEAINYHKWSVCSAACALGKSLGVPVYKFLKEPLIRKYGKAWYKELVGYYEAENKSRMKTKRLQKKG